MTAEEVVEMRRVHEEILRERGYPPETCCELRYYRERFFPARFREPVVKNFRKRRFS